MTHQEIIIAGFGGQGILSAGRILAYAGMLEGKNVSWLPSYGPEMRGGTANCHVIISDEPVGSPILNSATALIVMNGPSLEKFESFVVPGGLILTDSSLVTKSPARKDIDVCEIPATKMASDMGNLTYANIILIGKLIAKTGVTTIQNFTEALKKVLPEKKHYLIPEEIQALEAGMNY
ncbi:MAG: 2-oxoacid:acceptor oxidoreductase family protein [Clostridiales bacterium]|jgi:2-oxoglutarate ferredoxin oxidoreductase subunit gamma|nr:2-oxoacid:acceptor oxidoreductase family protein [Eubacteriales bacterium]MDH7564966.1 2-oxoacid:acceptor oxidoreductase family protein [Clostridiales bacterium]